MEKAVSGTFGPETRLQNENVDSGAEVEAVGIECIGFSLKKKSMVKVSRRRNYFS